MKKVKKITGLIMLTISLLVSMTTIAFASTSTTGLKDGVYVAQSTPDSNKQSYKLNVAISEGKVVTAEFSWYADTMKLTSTMVQYSPADQQASMKATLDEIADYNTQMSSLKDGANIVKYSKATNNTLYNTFGTLWKNIVSQAGGQIVDSSSTTTTTTTSNSTSNPKTGDSGNLLYIILAGAALVSMTVLRRKKITA